jgi:hypothetical protein
MYTPFKARILPPELTFLRGRIFPCYILSYRVEQHSSNIDKGLPTPTGATAPICPRTIVKKNPQCGFAN